MFQGVKRAPKQQPYKLKKKKPNKPKPNGGKLLISNRNKCLKDQLPKGDINVIGGFPYQCVHLGSVTFTDGFVLPCPLSICSGVFNALTFKKSDKFRFPWSNLLSQGLHMSGLVLSWVAMDLTVLVVSTEQLMHVIKTQNTDLCGPRWSPCTYFGSYHKMVLWSLINLRHSEKKRSEVANSRDIQCKGSTYALPLWMKSRSEEIQAVLQEALWCVQNVEVKKW